MVFFRRKLDFILIFACFFCYLNLSLAADYPQDSIEGLALAKKSELPNPVVEFPPFNANVATKEDKIKYSRAVCPLYVKAYEDIYLKQYHINKYSSPFAGFCETRSTKLNDLTKDSIYSKPELFKKSLDRISVSFELYGGLKAAQEDLVKSANAEKIGSQTKDMVKDVEGLKAQFKALKVEQVKIDSQVRTAVANSGKGLLSFLGLQKSMETKIIECALVVLWGLIGFALYQKSQF